MLKNKNLVVIGTCVLLSACVTINIYFPAAAAEKAADKIIEEVWQLKNKEADSKPADAPADKATDKPTDKTGTETAPTEKPAEPASK